MQIADFGTALMALGTAVVLYAIGWVMVRNAKPLWKLVWRLGLAALFFVPALYVLMVGLGDKRETAKAPPATRSAEATPPPAGPIPQRPSPQAPGSTAQTAPSPASDAAAKSAADAAARARAEAEEKALVERALKELPAEQKALAEKALKEIPAAGASAPPPIIAGTPAPQEPAAGGAMPPPAQPEASRAVRAPPRAIMAPSPMKEAEPLWDVVPVYFGTDRGQGPAGPRLTFSSARASRLALGQADITVPKSHEVPNVERPWALRVPFTNITIYQQAEDPAKHFTIKELKSLTEAEFIAAVKARLQKSQEFADHALVFIHGYNVDFDFALYRTAQMAYDLKFDGAPFMYSWPSASGLTGYIYDRDSAEQAEPYLRQFLELVVRQTGAKNVSIIAHSMGNLPTLRVLRELGPNLPAGVKLDQIVFASPDVDQVLFRQLAERIPNLSRGVTLYASSNDRAMTVSRLVTGGTLRAGDVGPEGPVIVAGIDSIDVSSLSLDTFSLNHSAYAEEKTVVNDIGRLLRSGLRPPDARLPTLVKITTPRGDYWRFP